MSEPVIGLEVHAQILCNTKLFSCADSDFFKPLNSTVSFFDCALPGTLPVLNRRCVESAVKTALALNCEINYVSRFDRKHYFYADMPAGYQITQQMHPIASDGFIEFYVYDKKDCRIPYLKKTKIHRIQLEQDSGKSFHELKNNRTLIDLNRAGCALMEIVLEPNLSSGLEAACLVSELMSILEDIQTCGCQMNRGQLRVDANVSIKQSEKFLGIKTEIKNLNSVKFVKKAIEYELGRHIECLRSGIPIVNQTMTYDYKTGETSPMRDKEVRQDYRYMPEPNLPPLRLYEKEIKDMKDPYVCLEKLRADMPLLRRTKRNEWICKRKIPMTTVLALEKVPDKLRFLDLCFHSSPTVDSEYLANQIMRAPMDFGQKNRMLPQNFSHFCDLLKNNLITSATFEQLLSSYNFADGQTLPDQDEQKKAWYIINDKDRLDALCDQILSSEAKAISDYKNGVTKTMKRFVRLAQVSLNGRGCSIQLEDIFGRKLQEK
uniref:Glutamyl-tRNA(Gln) amidotransferase subunit B, mitochondrial n=1 Tax=Romanomermis culicivorax TaxID=13658 RepID=A0A915IR86_ROMCU